MNDILENKAKDMAALLVQKHQFASVVATSSPFIDMLMELLKQLMPMVLKCFASPKAALDTAKGGLNFFQAWRLRRAIKNHLDDADMSTRMLQPLYDTFLDTAVKTSEEEVTLIFQSI